LALLCCKFLDLFRVVKTSGSFIRYSHHPSSQARLKSHAADLDRPNQQIKRGSGIPNVFDSGCEDRDASPLKMLVRKRHVFLCHDLFNRIGQRIVYARSDIESREFFRM
jgi:hypothetical protein